MSRREYKEPGEEVALEGLYLANDQSSVPRVLIEGKEVHLKGNEPPFVFPVPGSEGGTVKISVDINDLGEVLLTHDISLTAEELKGYSGRTKNLVTRTHVILCGLGTARRGFYVSESKIIYRHDIFDVLPWLLCALLMFGISGYCLIAWLTKR